MKKSTILGSVREVKTKGKLERQTGKYKRYYLSGTDSQGETTTGNSANMKTSKL